MNGNKLFIQEYLRALSGQPKPQDLIDKYVADDKLAKHIANIEAGFPRYELLPEQIVVEDDLVVVRGEFRGVHQGLFAGIEATGKAVSAGLIIIYRVQDQKIIDHWLQLDGMSLFQQLKEETLAASGSRG
jgi:predicted ester cyclase